MRQGEREGDKKKDKLHNLARPNTFLMLGGILKTQTHIRLNTEPYSCNPYSDNRRSLYNIPHLSI